MTAAEVVTEITRRQQELGKPINRRRQQHCNLQVLSLCTIRRHQNVDAPLQSPIRLLMMEAVIAARKNDIP